MGRHEVRWCFHTTAMVADYERTRDALVDLFGLRVLEDTRIDDPAIGRRGGMAWLGDNIIEIGEPTVEGGAVDRFVKRFGSHMSSLAVQVADIDATVGFLREQGVRIASQIDHDIVFTHPADTAGIVIEWFGAEEALDPRFGGPLPDAPNGTLNDAPNDALNDARNGPVLEVATMAFAGAVVADPEPAARRLAELFGREVTFVDGTADLGSPQAGVSLGDMTLALYRLPLPDQSEGLWGWRYERPQTCNQGLLVDDLSAARRELENVGVEVWREGDGCLVLGPSVTGGVTVVIVDDLLPGDPRRS